MDWIEGKPFGEFVKQETFTQTEANLLGQSMWDFYHFQMHQLKTIHADPHPGNFIITPDKKLGIIDFGCVKVIPADFHATYFQLLDRDILTNEEKLKSVFHDLRFIYDDDSVADKAIFKTIFTELIALLGGPFQEDTFDFSNPDYFNELFVLGTKISTMPEFRNSKRARGVKDALYINRTYFGLYQLLHELKASVSTRIKL
jgi:predicted unusual protein kinase regulating ubiquinone biosynthesis (AarF/ABC1/UbiB family)